MNPSANDAQVDISQLVDGLGEQGYIATQQIATAVYIGQQLQKPILVEGPAGVGKTELAKSVAALFDLELLRLQCYEGLDESKALYEWKYGKQLLYTQMLKEKLGDVLSDAEGLEESMQKLHQFQDVFFAEDFLEPRPLLKALKSEQGSVLLIDEVDKADYEFESLLLEILSDFQITIPELGTIVAENKPLVFLTSNNTRELSDALKRRCVHLYIDFPEAKFESEIVSSRVPEIADKLNTDLVNFVQGLRELDLKKSPSISETIDWARSLVLLNASQLDVEVVRTTLNLLLKFREDILLVDNDLGGLLRSSQERR